ncbi:MAG: ribosome small subunit-dependent GTPase A [Bacteriovoracaceae bacterium]|nr:ribosome small subunit-dependent GTPase A [Bacteriovoracaceae bacterium]
MRARVYRSSGREFECKLQDTQELVSACALGNLLRGDNSVTVGDFVQVEKIVENNRYQIVSVEKRKSEIFRVIVRENKKKVTAANCDVVVILVSVSTPKFKRGIVDRFLLRAIAWEITPVIVFNKMDEHSKDLVDLVFERDRLQSLGVLCFEISAKVASYEKKYLTLGMDDLKSVLKDKTSVFLGQSGVGKSKTINALSGGKVNLFTGDIGKVGKGKHTTTWSEIVDCDEFLLIDSPGIRSFSIEDVAKDELLEYFPDLAGRATACKFTNCGHTENSKGCSFFDISNYSSEYEMELVLSRLDSFFRMQEEITNIPSWDKKIK